MKNNIGTQIEEIFKKYNVPGLSIACTSGVPCELRSKMHFGVIHKSGPAVSEETRFQMASLSKTVGTAFALEYFARLNINLEQGVNDVLKEYHSPFSLKSAPGYDPQWAEQVCLIHLVNHLALDVHYVIGHPLGACPTSLDLLEGKSGTEAIWVTREPGKAFSYSGGGFLVLQHILELISGKDITSLMRPFLDGVGLHDFYFTPQKGASYACGYKDDGEAIAGGRLSFPALAAGGESSTASFACFLSHLVNAYHSVDGSGTLSHNTAVKMLYPERDRGSLAFMGAYMGLGVFIAEAGDNLVALHQAANDGFRGLYGICFEGPDCGQGFVICSNGDNQAMALNCEIARVLLKDWQGVKLGDMDLQLDGKKQEEIVNLGIKAAITDFFLPRLPELPEAKGEKSPFADYNKAAGAKIAYCSGQQFARAENLFSSLEPVFDPAEFGRAGKIMDSWESQRHNPDGVETLVFDLPQAVTFDLIHISTMFHDGNHCEHAALHAWDETQKEWKPILSKQALSGHSEHWFRTSRASQPFSRFKFSAYPDGGISRLGFFQREELRDSDQVNIPLAPEAQSMVRKYEQGITKAESKSFPSKQISDDKIEAFWQNPSLPLNVASDASGAKIIHCSDQHYGPADRILSEEAPQGMHDGLETKRSRGDHHESVTIQLNRPCDIDELVFDFSYFVYNNPNYLDVDIESHGIWQALVPKTKVKAWRGNILVIPCHAQAVESLKIRVYPDGGFNRIRVYGKASV